MIKFIEKKEYLRKTQDTICPPALGRVVILVPVLMLMLMLLLGGCIEGSLNNPFSPGVGDANRLLNGSVSNEQSPLVNEEGGTIADRYRAPEGFVRVDAEKGSFAHFLRNHELRPYGAKALYYDGREKRADGVYDSVFDVEIGDRDLHQCADAIMLLRAEYLYSIGAYDQISFHFVSGFKAEYKKWMEGYRIKVEGNDVSYYKTDNVSNTYETFRKFMDMVFAYSGTLSLEKELQEAGVDEMKIGDVFIVGGSPGHAVIVVDMAINEDGETLFMLAQSYMPAQQTHLLVNPNQVAISPWYSLKDQDKLITPEWTFELDALKRF